MVSLKIRAVCSFVLILSAFVLCTVTFGVNKKDAPLNRITPVQPANDARPIDVRSEAKDSDNEPTEVNWWKAKQAGDSKKAAGIRAVLDQEAKESWSSPSTDIVLDTPFLVPPQRGGAFNKSFMWGNDITITTGPVAAGISIDCDADNNLYAARCTTENATENACVRVYKSTDGGTSWFYLTGFYAYEGGFSFSYPVVLTGTIGDKLYVFYLRSNGNGQIGVVRFLQNGDWEAFYDVKVDDDTITYLSACSNFGRGDTLMVAYQRELNGPRFYTLRSTDQGETWGNQSYVDDHAAHPDIAYGRDRLAYAAWEKVGTSDREIWFFRRTIGGSWSELEYLTEDTYDQTYPKIAALHTLPASDAHVWVAYTHNWSTAKGDDTLEYHDEAMYYWLNPRSTGDELYNVRFSPAWTYSLKAAQLMFYESPSVGSNGVRVYVWDSDGEFPTEKVDSVDVPYGSLNWYPNWTTVDFSGKNITLVPADFHIGYNSLGNDTIAIISDDGEPAGTEHRSCEWWGGAWGTMYNWWGIDVNFFIRAVVEEEATGTGYDLRYAYSTNAGADWSKNHDLANSTTHYEGACDLWPKRDGGFMNMNVCYLKYRFDLYSLSYYSYIYYGWTSPSDPTYWHTLTRISDHWPATNYDGRRVCAGVYSGYNRGILYAGRQSSVFGINHLNLYYDNSSWVDVEDEVTFQEHPTGFYLSANYPNPFNPATSIQYTVNGCSVPTTLKIFNIRGQLVRTLVDKLQGAGTYSVTWDGRDDAGEQVASGVYLYKLEAGDFSQAKKMVLIR